ncbi:DUF4853 domain-containing protein [Buchananella hordeovulneris]|uniref:DUF4853 domain-containing protein n=1 Tax=Buchananella hordeovulneris TaxID=52770 RepID=UPI0026DD83BF|nr:DUF4853 domain-containing protein [Buchananella hordeovulneris]MDO5080713.1 DUF4853 domain-containing protein [Buchananella hordeovulneris]
MRRQLLLSILALVVMLGGCGVNGPKNNDPRYGDGSLPVEERQSLEEFVSDVEPGIVEFMQSLDVMGSNLWLPESNESSLESCGYPVYGYKLRGATLFGQVIPEVDVKQLYERHIKSLGFTYVYRRSDQYGLIYKWFNIGDGGYVNVTLLPDGKLVASYVSGCRPYRGEGAPEHVRTAWEQELIARQPPTADTSDSPTPSESDTAGK